MIAPRIRVIGRNAALAQLVERSFRKAQVTGSSPVGGFDLPTESLKLVGNLLGVIDETQCALGLHSDSGQPLRLLRI